MTRELRREGAGSPLVCWRSQGQARKPGTVQGCIDKLAKPPRHSGGRSRPMIR
jgi:hypothetical protein